jgi:GNAT superfamily N-acetyltransferase
MPQRPPAHLIAMSLHQRHATGLEYLDLVTDLLQRIRVESPEAGIWEAADMQWAWRRDQHADPNAATFWIDDDDNPVAAVVISNRLGCDLMLRPAESHLLPEMWSVAEAALKDLADGEVEMAIRDDYSETIAIAVDAGFAADNDVAVSCWLNAADRPQITDLASGYRLLSRADKSSTPHHMIMRSGEHVAERLKECSLYDPSFDLFVEAPDGSVAAYGLFWPDLITGVGLVEPMRTEDAHQNRGLARHILTAGVEQLAGSGCTRMKITYMDDNPASKHIYRSAGFQPADTARSYRRSLSV